MRINITSTSLNILYTLEIILLSYINKIFLFIQQSSHDTKYKSKPARGAAVASCLFILMIKLSLVAPSLIEKSFNQSIYVHECKNYSSRWAG